MCETIDNTQEREGLHVKLKITHKRGESLSVKL